MTSLSTTYSGAYRIVKGYIYAPYMPLIIEQNIQREVIFKELETKSLKLCMNIMFMIIISLPICMVLIALTIIPTVISVIMLMHVLAIIAHNCIKYNSIHKQRMAIIRDNPLILFESKYVK